MSYEGATRIARTMTVLVRGRGDIGAVVATTKQVLHEIDPALPLFNIRSVKDIVDQSVGQPRLKARRASRVDPLLAMRGD